MAQAAHLESLKTKHFKIDEQIKTLQQAPMPDTIHLTQLKRQKLQLKEQIEALT